VLHCVQFLWLINQSTCGLLSKFNDYGQLLASLDVKLWFVSLLKIDIFRRLTNQSLTSRDANSLLYLIGLTVCSSYGCFYCILISLRFNGYFPGDPGLAGSIGAKDDGSGGDNWSYNTCKTPVKSSAQTNTQLFTGRRPFLSPNQ